MRSRFFYGWIVAVAASWIMLMQFGTFLSFGIFFEPVVAEFGWTSAITASAYAIATVARGSIYAVGGRLTDKYGPRIVVTVCGLIFGASYLLMSQISSLWHFYLLYLLVGASMGGSWIPLSSTVARWFEKRRGLATGIVASGEGLGIVIVALVARWLISIYQWRFSYLAVGTAALLFITPAAQFLRRDPGQMGLSPYGRSEVRDMTSGRETRQLPLPQAIHTREFWLLSAIYFCLLFNLGTIMTHIAVHTTSLGFSTTTAANILAIIGGISIIGRLIMGVFADRTGGKPAMIICLALLTAAMLWLQSASAVWMLYLFAAIFGFVFGGLVTTFPLITGERFGLSSHGAIFGVISLVAMMGGALGSVSIGHVFDVTGSYQAGFLICAAMSALGLSLTLLSQPVPQ